MIGALADGVVNVVRAGHRRKAWLSAVALLATLVVAGAYLFWGALRINPLASTYRVLIELPESGGLLANQDVTLRGVPIGRVEALALAPTGVNATVRLDSSFRIPASTAAPTRTSTSTAARGRARIWRTAASSSWAPPPFRSPWPNFSPTPTGCSSRST